MNSQNYQMWCANLDSRLCVDCEDTHGKVYTFDEWIDPEPPLHPNCRCKIIPLRALYAGTATNNGKDGADWWLKKYGKLPNYYISREEALKLGWKKKQGNLHQVAPGKMMARGQYYNDDGHLPSAPGRIWHEADINYISGRRGDERIVFSNDGLIFVTYDHYVTFCEIV